MFVKGKIIPNSALESLGCFSMSTWGNQQILTLICHRLLIKVHTDLWGWECDWSVEERAGDIGERVVKNGSNRLGIRSRSGRPC